LKTHGKGIGFGRICLWGDHCDWAGTQVIASSIDRVITTKATRREDDLVTIRAINSIHGSDDSESFSLGEAGEIPLGNSSLKYVNAVVAALMEKIGGGITGVDLHIESNVPMRKGLSSSAAICVSTASALSDLFQLDLPRDEIVRIAYRAERGILKIACGMMDQTASIFEYPVFIDFNDGFSYQRVDLKGELPIVIADVGGERDTKLILNTLNRFYLEEKDPLIVKTLREEIPDIVARARDEMGNKCRLEVLGALMDANQECYDRGLRPFCESELGSPLLYRALETAKKGGALGAKWTGAGGSGSIIALAEDLNSRDRLAVELEKCCRSVMPTSIG